MRSIPYMGGGRARASRAPTRRARRGHGAGTARARRRARRGHGQAVPLRGAGTARARRGHGAGTAAGHGGAVPLRGAGTARARRGHGAGTARARRRARASRDPTRWAAGRRGCRGTACPYPAVHGARRGYGTGTASRGDAGPYGQR